MSNPTSDVTQPSLSRPVLIWGEDADTSQVQPTVQQAAEVLGVSADEVVAAINSGEPLKGHFVDWEASR